MIFDMQALRRELESLYDFPVPLRRVGAEPLYAGTLPRPTCAFKDFGAGFMGRVVGLLGAAGERLVILTATSGDTGSAVAHGFYNVPGVDVVVLYPRGEDQPPAGVPDDGPWGQYPSAARGRGRSTTASGW